MFHCFYRFFRINIQYAHIAGRCIDRTRRDNPQEKNLQKKKNRGIYTAGGARNSANV